ncbi:MAG: hypothetical protein LRY73_03910 [Bacillus sp. (in: Bacteria)]|nr:hypothetical protein [Bacillus sp. (in: firmicutes)]
MNFYWEDEGEEGSEDTEGEAGEEIETEGIPVQEAQLPEGLKRLAVTMNFRAPSYENILQFLTVVESLERLTKIDSISFGGTRGEEISVNISLTTFYAEGLDELIEDLPQIEHIDPANKTNPLPRRSTNESTNESNNSDDDDNDDNNDDE